MDPVLSCVKEKLVAEMFRLQFRDIGVDIVFQVSFLKSFDTCYFVK